MQHDPAVAHGVDVFIGDVVGQRDRRLARIGLGLAADGQLAACNIDPLGLELDIEIVRKAELAVDRQAAQRRRTDVEDHCPCPGRDRHRVAFARHLALSGHEAGSDQSDRWTAEAGACAGMSTGGVSATPASPKPRTAGRSKQRESNRRSCVRMMSIPSLGTVSPAVH